MLRLHRRLLPAVVCIVGGLVAAAHAGQPRALADTTHRPAPELVWEASGFVAPESAVFDADRQQFYVSNMGTWGQGATPGDGFVSRVSTDGRILDLRWVTGFENPKGLALANDRLYVGDDAALVEIDPASGTITSRHAPPDGPGGFNDVTADPSGAIHVFSRRLATAFRLRAGVFEPWAKVDLATSGAPNGLHAEHDRLILGSWVARGADGLERFGILSTVAFADGSLKPLGSDRIGNIDGIEPDGRGGYTVTDWQTGDVLHVTADGVPTRIMTLRRGAADHHYVAAQRLLIVPLVLDNVVRAYRWAPAMGQRSSDAAPVFDAVAAQRFADLALACVHKEYPGKIAHVLSSDKDVLPPRTLTPAFFGCYDWHSSVHGHWLLARLARTFPRAAFASRARAALARSLTPANVAAEVRYLEGPGRTSFERPYGLAWLLQLAAELRAWDDPQARRWSAALAPLESAAAARLKAWLPKLTHPIRVGEHDQTAFAFGLVLDWARAAGDREMETLLGSRIEHYYLKDKACPLDYEPSGQDFLSPCLGEADLMRRVLPPDRYATWLAGFLPALPRDGSTAWLAPAVVTDASDPKLAHLDGLNLSRAWMLDGMARGLPAADSRVAGLQATAAAHREAGLRAVTGAHYEGGHWLGSFAVYLVTAAAQPKP